MKYVFLLLLLVFPRFSRAQITIETVTTDTVNIFNSELSQQSPRFSNLILLSTLILPGAGHQITGFTTSALGYITFDLLSLFGAIYFNNYKNGMISTYKSYASNYAGISSQINDDYFWEIIGSFDNYNDFHETINLVREKDNRFKDGKYFWTWDDSLYRSEYVTMQKKSKKLQTVSSVFIGAMILNRIVSFIDLRSKKKNNLFPVFNSFSFKPVIINSTSNGIILSCDF